MHKQKGAIGMMIVALIAILGTVLAAIWLLSRVGDTTAERDETVARLNDAATALDSFVAASQRLPCPAKPGALDDGTEDGDATTGDCNTADGTIPWKTIGLARERGLDAWGRKLSYRVYGAAPGPGTRSLTQPRGASMADCDTNESFPGALVGDLCAPANPANTDPKARNTTPQQFLSGKGLKLNYFGKLFDPDSSSTGDHVAYILISHGATGLGAYTVSGKKLNNPASPDEQSNLAANAGTTYVAKTFSGPDVGTKDNDFFDDLLVYRTIEDLAKRANLAPRNWPDDVVASAVFNQANLKAALGHNPSSDTGTKTVKVNNVTVTAFAGSTDQNISYQGGSSPGIGGIGDGDALTNGGPSGDEGLRLDFAEKATRLAFTLSDFGYYVSGGTPTWYEQVEIRFFVVSGTTVTEVRDPVTADRIMKKGCNPDGGYASFANIEAPVTDAAKPRVFNRVEIRPVNSTTYSSTPPTVASSFFLSEVRACLKGVDCHTDLEAMTNLCS